MASANNLNFTAANGTEIKNNGLRSIKALTNEGDGVKVDVYGADVKSNLASGMRITQSNNRIVLDSEGSYIENKLSGNKIHIRHENGCFLFDLWVPSKPKSTVNNAQSASRNNKKETTVRRDDMDVSTVFVRQEDL